MTPSREFNEHGPVFNDEDLKRLKELREYIKENPLDQDARSHYMASTLMDLPKVIARLEAADKACDLLEANPPGVRGTAFNAAMRTVLKAWRRAAGK